MIVFDLQAAQSKSSGHRGIGRYTRELAAALAARHPNLVDAFCWNAELPFDDRLGDIVPAERLVTLDSLAGASIDVYHVASPFEHLPIEWMLPRAFIRTMVATCFDLIPLRFQDRYLHGGERADYFARLPMLLGCDAIVTDSQSAADDCVELLGVPAERLTVIGGGVHEGFGPPSAPLNERIESLRRLLPTLRPGFVLVPTGMDWRKNTEGAIGAYAALPAGLQQRHQLVINCKVTTGERAWIAQHVKAFEVAGEVLVPGYVTDEQLTLLYQSAGLVLFPSKYEGFGLPVLEARRCGARVICSNVSSLPEVMPLAEATFNPWAIDDIADVLHRALTDGDFGAALDAAPDPGFTFEVAADRAAEVYRTLQKRSSRRTRRRLAVVTLLPPSPSGVADHSAALLEELHRLADVTCFVADDVFPPGTPVRPYDVRRLELLPMLARGGAFDAVLYCMGNNELHTPFLQYIDQLPGHVLLHDVRLVECYSPTRQQSMRRRRYAGQDTTPLYAADVAAQARACLVQSRHAAELLAADCGAEAIVVGPHPLRCVAPLPAPDRTHVVSLGIASSTKQSAKVVDAMERVVSRHPDWSASLVGLGSGHFVSAGSAVHAHGHVGDVEFENWLDRATVLVQLRDLTNGESSGVVAHALARGIPTIVTDLGAQAELPDDAVVKVPRTIDAGELAELIEALVADAGRRDRLASAARRYAAANTYRHQAERILRAIFGGALPPVGSQPASASAQPGEHRLPAPAEDSLLG